jgi:NAD(P)-dependent dehydrogenase (short-subunit alcohol dehydrogenase family)
VSDGAAATRALITGGTKGIGRAVAMALARRGARILVNYAHDDAAATAAEAEIRSVGAWAKAVRADAGTVNGAAQLAREAATSLRALDVVVHCAVAAEPADALTIEPPVLMDLLGRNGASLLWLVQACAELLAPGSSVVYLTSAGSTQAVRRYVGVGAAKALGEALARYLAAELAPRGVRVNAVSAGPVDTEALRAVAPDGADRLLAAAARNAPAGRGLTAADVAEAVLLLCDPGAAMIQGEVLHVDGGLRLVR